MALEDTLSAPIVRPVHVGLLDFATDPVRGWTGPGTFVPSGTGDADLDGQTFYNVSGAINISDFTENQNIGESLTITFAVGEMADEEIYQQLVVDQRAYMARKAKIWLFFLNADESAVLADYAVMFNGVMIGADFTRQPGSPAIVTIKCDADIKQANRPPTRWIEHQRFYPTDTASRYLTSLGRKATVVSPYTPAYPGQYPWNPDNYPY